MRQPEEIADIINHYRIFDTYNPLGELLAKIGRDFTVGEIRLFSLFLRGEDWSRYDPEWHRDTSKYIARKDINFDALVREIDRLVRICYLYIGAASVLKINGAHLFAYEELPDGDLLDLTLDQLVRAVPKEYRKQLDAATKLDTILSATADLKAQGDRIETQTSKTAKNVDETRQGVGVLVQHLPDAKKPTVIEWDEAVVIMKAKGGDPTWSARTGRNWLKAGKAAKTGTPISWDDLATTASWSAWVDAYLAALKSKLSKKSFISERKAQAEAAENRRRGRIA